MIPDNSPEGGSTKMFGTQIVVTQGPLDRVRRWRCGQETPDLSTLVRGEVGVDPVRGGCGLHEPQLEQIVIVRQIDNIGQAAKGAQNGAQPVCQGRRTELTRRASSRKQVRLSRQLSIDDHSGDFIGDEEIGDGDVQFWPQTRE